MKQDRCLPDSPAPTQVLRTSQQEAHLLVQAHIPPPIQQPPRKRAPLYSSSRLGSGTISEPVTATRGYSGLTGQAWAVCPPLGPIGRGGLSSHTSMNQHWRKHSPNGAVSAAPRKRGTHTDLADTVTLTTIKADTH